MAAQDQKTEGGKEQLKGQHRSSQLERAQRHANALFRPGQSVRSKFMGR